MNVVFNFFDEVALKIDLVRSPGGGYACAKAFLTFLERPANPHATFHSDPRRGRFELTPHFKVAGRPTVWFPPLRPEALKHCFDAFGEEASRRFSAALEPVQLADLERDGWTVHSPDFDFIARQWRRAPNRRSFRVTARSLEAFMWHVLRRWALPTQLDTLPKDKPLRFLAVRGGNGDEFELRALFFFPGAGWHIQRLDWFTPETVEAIFPINTLEADVFEPVVERLRSVPRKKKSLLDEIERLPRFLSQMIGFFGSDLINLALSEAIASANPPDVPPKT